MNNPLISKFRSTVRLRLLLMALLPMVLVMPLMLWVTVSNLSKRFDDVLTAKVSGELTIAHQHLDGLMQTRLAAITALGQSADMADMGGDPAGRDRLLRDRRAVMGLDFVTFIAAPKTGIYAGTDWPVVQTAAGGLPAVGIDVLTAEQLAMLAPELAARAQLDLMPTPAAVPTDRRTETRGMIIHAAAPAPGGIIAGGVLLNRNLRFIDEINDLVYPEQTQSADELGTATLFLDDVRISTNVRMFDGVRALGTRVSAAVRERVLEHGETWLARAFVVNDWYISAYEPVVDSFGSRVGMLYVGFLEQPFVQEQVTTIRYLVIGAIIALIATGAVLLWWAQGIFRPLERMTATIARVDGGDLAARTGVLNRNDEIAQVAARLDDLLDQLAARETALRELNESLEERVKTRTNDLVEANRQLKIATGQLVLSEKLASIGEVAAGMAHEINNPLAVIQGNLDVIQQELGAQAQPLSTEFRLIFEQADVIHQMVEKLLQFARPDEFSSQSGVDDLDGALRRVKPLIGHILRNHDVVFDLSAQCGVALPTNELQQVLVNLSRNAIDAMPEGGTLTLRSRRAGDWATVTVSDTGTGMDADTLARAFDPFFTRKPATGTGLGLSIAKKTITQAGGDITATSAPGDGTCFTITLPVMPRSAS